jgi:hypothetical protein
MRAMAIIIVIMGLASLVFGILYVTQAASAENEVAESIAPLPLDQLDDSYDQIKAAIKQIEDAGGTPELSMKLQKTGLGLARANAGTARSVRVNGVVDICVGLGLVLAGLALLRKAEA